MLIDLTNKTALITGSTSGIGWATARALHAAGATVVINGRDAARTAEAAGRIGHERVLAVAADVASAEGCAQLRRVVPDVDILVNNAGAAAPRPALEITDAEWEDLLALNLMSGIRLTRDYLPGMLERGTGRIVFVSSESGVDIPAEMVHYGVTKLAQLGVARGFAEAIAGSPVTINSVLPGPTLTPALEGFMDEMIGDRAASPEEASALMIEEVRPTSLIKRLADPGEVANLIVYLCSSQASATTGAAIRVDGGVLRSVL